MHSLHQDKILILDYGSQYTQLIARRIRQLGVYCEIYAGDVAGERIQEFSPRGIILSGGPETVTVQQTMRAPQIIFELGIPLLGICYGMQTMTEQLGGKVEAFDHREFGYAAMTVLDKKSELFENIEDHMDENGLATLDVWMSHGDRITKVPAGFKVQARTSHTPIAAMADETRNFYGLQFHPEVTHTRQGMRILEKFVKGICQCKTEWTTANIIDEQIVLCREQIKEDKVLLALSGGVDSSVTAALLHKAIGSNLICVFVDTGLLRLGEVEQVQRTFAQHLGIPLITVDASQRFFSELEDIQDPEQKRKIIGKLFIEVFAEEARKQDDVQWLAQGTIYPDVIESAGSKTGKAHVIKSHHNVGGLPDVLPLKLVEPLRELFKDEVRQVGLALGLPHDLLFRHPFPGPGLAVRILGKVKRSYAEILRQADYIFIEELHKANLYHQVNQAFCVYLPVRSVGVVGDARQYEPVIALRAVETIDFMTARWARLPYELLEHVSLRIVNEVKGISRVVYDVTGKPPATIEWE